VRDADTGKLSVISGLYKAPHVLKDYELNLVLRDIDEQFFAAIVRENIATWFIFINYVLLFLNRTLKKCSQTERKCSCASTCCTTMKQTSRMCLSN